MRRRFAGRDVDVASAAGTPARQRTSFADAHGPDCSGRERSAIRVGTVSTSKASYILPPDFNPARKYPALVNVHGGGTNSFLLGLNPIEQALAAKGYVVLAVNYRGGSGFGRAFQDLGVQDWANGQARDAAAAADFVRSLPYSSGQGRCLRI